MTDRSLLRYTTAQSDLSDIGLCDCCGRLSRIRRLSHDHNCEDVMVCHVCRETRSFDFIRIARRLRREPDYAFTFYLSGKIHDRDAFAREHGLLPVIERCRTDPDYALAVYVTITVADARRGFIHDFGLPPGAEWMFGAAADGVG
jgi:hypothetical protein